MQVLGKRQARVLSDIVTQDIKEPPCSDELRQVQENAVRVLFGDGPVEEDAQHAPQQAQQPHETEQDTAALPAPQQEQPRAPVNVSNGATNGESDHRTVQDKGPPASSGCAEVFAPESATTIQPEANGSATQLAQGNVTSDGVAADEPAPVGVRKKRSIAMTEAAPQAGKHPLKTEQQVAGKAGGQPAHSEQGTAGGANGAVGGAMTSEDLKTAIRKLQERWAGRLCGVDIDRKGDVFIAWSEHIQNCDKQEMQTENDEGPR
jgi:hypothetical protein